MKYKTNNEKQTLTNVTKSNLTKDDGIYILISKGIIGTIITKQQQGNITFIIYSLILYGKSFFSNKLQAT